MILSGLQQNCSLTTLDLEGHYDVDKKFLEKVRIELEKNKKIVETIFPKITE